MAAPAAADRLMLLPKNDPLWRYDSADSPYSCEAVTSKLLKSFCEAMLSTWFTFGTYPKGGNIIGRVEVGTDGDGREYSLLWRERRHQLRDLSVNIG